MSPKNIPQGTQPGSGVTMKDVAAHAGVSTATVSRVLSGKGGVSQELQQRVRQSIQTLDYYPNQAARRLRERNTKIIGVLVPDIQIPFFASIVIGIESVLHQAGYLLLLGNTRDEVGSEQEHINTFLVEDVSGVVFAAANSAEVSHYKKLQQAGIPLVAIDRKPGSLELDIVQIDNITAAARAVQHLIEDGYRSIALISGPDRISTAPDRMAGYERGLQAAGIPCDPALIQSGDFLQAGGYRAMKALMEGPTRPEAVLSANNVMTLGALQYIHECKFEIPDDIALISFDDMAWAPALRPPLTVVAQPVHEIGMVSARLLLDRIREPSGSIKHVMLQANLILRASCGYGHL